MRTTLALLALLALHAQTSAQTSVHVSPLGDDTTGDGSISLPFRTIDRAMLSVSVGGVVRAAGGAYPFAATIDKSVTIEADGSGVPVLGPRPTPGPIVTVAGVADVTLRGVEIAGSAGQLGVRVLGPADRFALVDCALHDLGGNGIEFTGLASVDARVFDCRFLRVHTPSSSAIAIDASGTTRLTITGCDVDTADFGVRLVGASNVAVVDCTFVDLAQSAVLAIAAPDLLLEDVRATRCTHFAGPSAWGSPSDQLGAIALANLTQRATLRRVLVEDCGGYVGHDGIAGRYDGLFGVSVDGSDDAVLEDCALHRNAYGGLLVTGGSSGLVVHDSSFVANGSRNGPGDDTALHADVASVDAASCFWGVPAGPIFDGIGLGNGIAGGALVNLLPIASRPARAVVTSMEFDTALPGGLRPRDLLVTDVGGDAAADIVAVEDLVGDVRVHLRAGAGFAPPIVTHVGGLPVAVVAGQFDNDGFVDLAVVDENGDRVVVLFGDGSGGFPRRTDVATARRPLRVAAGPLDGVAGDDLAIACAGDVFSGGALQVARGDGLGGFTITPLSGATTPTDAALVDLNSDGRLEVVAYDVDRAAPGLRSWLNLGGGAFATAVHGPVDAGPILDATLARIDLDGLGGRDLAVARFTLLPGPGITTIDVYRNSGGGVLLGPTRVDDVLGPAEMAAGDVGEHGATRLCVALPALGEVRAYGPIEAQSTPFAPYAEVLFQRPYPQSVAVGELTGDGAEDVLVADAASGALEIWRGRLPAEVEIYGAGCPGERGVPLPRWRSVPEIGASSFAVEFENGPTGGSAFLLISILPGTIPIAGGCSLLVQPNPFAVQTTANASGYGTTPLGVPYERTLVRSELFAQWWLLDPAGAAFGALSSSAGLRIHVGG